MMDDLAYARKMRALLDQHTDLTVQLREYRIVWRDYTTTVENNDTMARRLADSQLLRLWNGMIESERAKLYAIMDQARV